MNINILLIVIAGVVAGVSSMVSSLEDRVDSYGQTRYAALECLADGPCALREGDNDPMGCITDSECELGQDSENLYGWGDE